MGVFSDRADAARRGNQKALAAFGAAALSNGGLYRTIREGAGPKVFTVGYEGRDGDGLMAALRDAGVECLIDVRERPWSRRADFRLEPLRQFCADARIEYHSWPILGSTEHQREQLRENGDFALFRKRFRDVLQRSRADSLAKLADVAAKTSVALLCYERCHDECHRSVITDLLGEQFDATVIALA